MKNPSQALFVFKQSGLNCMKIRALSLFFNSAYQLQMPRNEQVHHVAQIKCRTLTEDALKLYNLMLRDECCFKSARYCREKENAMKRTLGRVVCGLLMVAMVSGAAPSAEKKAPDKDQEIMITGTINNNQQIVDRGGQVFSIARTQEGNELVSHVGMKVQVKGSVAERKGKRWITILHYEIVKR
jgi:hypothetical protein